MTTVMDNLRQFPGTLRQTLIGGIQNLAHSFQRRWLIVLVVVIFGFLNQLGCIVHCHLAIWAEAQNPWGLHICGHSGESADSSEDTESGIPRAPIELSSPGIILMGSMLWFVIMLVGTVQHQLQNTFLCPPSPPPRLSTT